MKGIRTRIFVGCEGASERSYIRWLQALADEQNKSVHFDPHIAGGGDPLSVVEQSLTKMKAQERKTRKYKHRAILFDTDKIGQSPQRDAQIPVRLKGQNISLLSQEFDHEALLLRHFKNCHTLRPPKKRSLVELKKRWPEYDKPADSLELGKRLSLADFERMLGVEPAFNDFFRTLVIT